MQTSEWHAPSKTQSAVELREGEAISGQVIREGFLGEVVFEQSYECMHDFGRWRVSEYALRAANNTTKCATSPVLVGGKPGKVGDRLKYPAYGTIFIQFLWFCLRERENGLKEWISVIQIHLKNFVTQAFPLKSLGIICFLSLDLNYFKY